jgi:hypothetical protein
LVLGFCAPALTRQMFQGEFKNGELDGIGEYKFASGDRYYGVQFPLSLSLFSLVVGFFPLEFFFFVFLIGCHKLQEFKRNKMNGQGTYYFKDGTSIRGTWRDGKRVS